MKKTPLPALMVLLAAGLALPSCSTNQQGDDANPVFVTCDFSGFTEPGNYNVNATIPLLYSMTLRNRPKATSPATTQFLDVQTDSYTIVWTRIDGGKTASRSETFGGIGIVPFNGSLVANTIPVMSLSNLAASPLDRLFPFNGGIDPETGKTEIRQTATITWYGHMMNGSAIVSVPATFDMIFLYVPTTGRIVARPVSRG